MGWIGMSVRWVRAGSGPRTWTVSVRSLTTPQELATRRQTDDPGDEQDDRRRLGDGPPGRGLGSRRRAGFGTGHEVVTHGGREIGHGGGQGAAERVLDPRLEP